MSTFKLLFEPKETGLLHYAETGNLVDGLEVDMYRLTDTTAVRSRSLSDKLSEAAGGQRDISESEDGIAYEHHFARAANDGLAKGQPIVRVNSSGRSLPNLSTKIALGMIVAAGALSAQASYRPSNIAGFDAYANSSARSSLGSLELGDVEGSDARSISDARVFLRNVPTTLSNLQLSFFDDEISIAWVIGERHASVSLEGDGLISYAYKVDGTFVPGKDLRADITYFPRDLANYLIG